MSRGGPQLGIDQPIIRAAPREIPRRISERTVAASEPVDPPMMSLRRRFPYPVSVAPSPAARLLRPRRGSRSRLELSRPKTAQRNVPRTRRANGALVEQATTSRA